MKKVQREVLAAARAVAPPGVEARLNPVANGAGHPRIELWVGDAKLGSVTFSASPAQLHATVAHTRRQLKALLNERWPVPRRRET